MSPLLFILAMEPFQKLFDLVTADGSLSPIQHSAARVRMSMYVDSVAIFLKPGQGRNQGGKRDSRGVWLSVRFGDHHREKCGVSQGLMWVKFWNFFSVRSRIFLANTWVCRFIQGPWEEWIFNPLSTRLLLGYQLGRGNCWTRQAYWFWWTRCSRLSQPFSDCLYSPKVGN